MIHTVVEGLKYVKGQQVLWGTLVLALIIESSGWTFHTTLMPIFARDELDADSAGLGLLLFAFGTGAVAASLGWAMIGNLRHVGKLMIGSVVLWHASILVFSIGQRVPLRLGQRLPLVEVDPDQIVELPDGGIDAILDEPLKAEVGNTQSRPCRALNSAAFQCSIDVRRWYHDLCRPHTFEPSPVERR